MLGQFFSSTGNKKPKGSKNLCKMYIQKYKLIIMFVKNYCSLLLTGKTEHDCATISLRSVKGKLYIAYKEVKEQQEFFRLF